MISDEALPFYRFVPYIFRTADFRTWEVGAINPVLWYSEEDRRPAFAGVTRDLLSDGL